MRAPQLRYPLLLSSMLLSGFSAAQDLTLFEPVDAGPAEAQPVQPQFTVNQNGQPAFTVRGTVRVGDSYQVSLVTREGVVKNVDWRPGERIGVPGAETYQILDVKPRSVVLSLPANDPCIEAPNLGVRCADASQALLSLATAAPLPPTANMGAQNPQFANGQVNNGVPGAPQNPFEAAIQAQQAAAAQQGIVGVQPGQTVVVDSFGQQQLPPEVQARRAQRLGQFQPTRIPDDQIPQGMRRVTTPFGDRLIPVRE